MLQIYNQTSKEIIASDAKIAESFSDQILGLLNPKNPRTLVFYTRWGIHTFGLQTPIGVLVLDSENKVVQKKLIKPWRIFVWNPKYSVIVELPVELASHVKVADSIIFKKATRGT